jgi:carbon starvation protein CstA
MATVNTETKRPTRARGVGSVLIVVYAILALAATARSFFQIARDFDDAPLAYTLSAVSAVVYIVATIALIAPGEVWKRVAWITISFELIGVIVVGLLSFVAPELFGHPTVWSWFGMQYGFVPLLLPVFGLLWLYRTKKVSA